MKLLYGYTQNQDQKIVINQTQATTVKLIYHLYLQGKSLGGIIEYLKQSNTLSPTGKTEWTRATVDNILFNKKYVPCIISLEQFIAIQFEKDKRTNLQPNDKRKTVRYNSQNVLSGLLICGDCGRNYHRITRSSGVSFLKLGFRLYLVIFLNQKI